MQFRRNMVLVLLAALALLAACGGGKPSRTPPCGQTPQVPYSEDLAHSLDARLSPYLQGQAGPFSLRTTSQELTSWLAYVERQWPGIPLRSATVWFSPERVYLSGVVSRVTPLSLRVTLHMRVWLDGQIVQVAVEEACLGRVSLPGWLKRLLQRVINETIVDAAPFFRCTALQVGQSTLLIEGELRP